MIRRNKQFNPPANVYVFSLIKRQSFECMYAAFLSATGHLSKLTSVMSVCRSNVIYLLLTMYKREYSLFFFIVNSTIVYNFPVLLIYIKI